MIDRRTTTTALPVTPFARRVRTPGYSGPDRRAVAAPFADLDERTMSGQLMLRARTLFLLANRPGRRDHAQMSLSLRMCSRAHTLAQRPALAAEALALAVRHATWAEAAEKLADVLPHHLQPVTMLAEIV